MNAKEQQRGTVLNRMERGGLTGQQAARLMGLSLRQVRRLLAAYRKDGVAALAHGNRGRSPLHRIQEETRDMVVELARGPYRGFNHYQLQEELAEREGLHLSRSSLWRILTGAKVPSSRRRRKAQYRQRRERYPQEGMLLQVDGNRHDWLEGRGPYLSLLAVIDDATSALPAALFREQEDAHGYLLLLEEVIRNKGIPLAIYSDRHGIFQVNPKQRETVEEQLAGERQPTQFGRALEELGIESIVAHTPQAKGRVERLFGTLQDRLVSHLRLAGAASLEEANRALGEYLPRHNRCFGVLAAQPGTAYRETGADTSLAAVLCFKYRRTVANDNTVKLGEHTLQILPGPEQESYARTRVQVQERLDGSLAVIHQGKVLATGEAPPLPLTLRSRKGIWRQNLRGPEPTAPIADSTITVTKGRVRAKPQPAFASPEDNPLVHKPGPHHPWRRFHIGRNH